MAVSAENTEKANQLKLEGNAFYGKTDFQSAYDKYSEAIEYDPYNPFLYANRSATSYALKEYIDAATDAAKAVELDPKYGKGWLRLANAAQVLCSWHTLENAAKSGLECLPAEADMSNVDKTFKSQMETFLNSAQSRLGGEEPPGPNRRRFGTIEASSRDLKEMPWLRAQARERQMLAQVAQSGNISSGFVILSASREFRDGVKHMMTLQTREVDGATLGHSGTIAEISNGILRDPRVFHAETPDWGTRYDKQLLHEIRWYNAWFTETTNFIKQEVLKRLKAKGWDKVRPAITLTIRAWFLTGFFECATGSLTSGVEYYQRAIDLLEWGCQQWANVPSEDRGAIFEKTFLRGVKRSYIDAIMRYIAETGEDTKYTKEDLVDLAREIISDVNGDPTLNSPIQPYPGDIAAFWMYPKGDAYSVLGWVHMQCALSTDDEADVNYNLREAYKNYVQAAESIPVDDENHVSYLKTALEALWHLKTPVGQTLPLCKRIRTAVPGMKLIWERAPGWRERDRNLQEAVDYELKVSKLMLDGSITQESFVEPVSI